MTTGMPTLKVHKAIDEAGAAVVAAVLSQDQIAQSIAEAERLFARHGRRGAGIRRAIVHSEFFRALAGSREVLQLVAPVLGESAFVVRSILFDKSPDANWDVAWHQDTTIAVAERIDTPGFGPWSVKEGIVHVRPPAPVLENMLTVRLHIDPCGEDNGPLLVARGTHRHGVHVAPPDHISLDEVCFSCTTEAGGAVLMRPLVFHASRKSHKPSHRRVLHLEFACESLRAPLWWTSA